MNNANILKDWAKFSEAREKERIEFEAAQKAKLDAIVGKVKTAFVECFKTADEIYQNAPSEVQENLASDKDILKLLKTWSERTGKRTLKVGRTRKGSVSEEEILKYLATERTTQEIVDNFGFSKPTFAKYMNQLKGKVSSSRKKDSGLVKYWKTI